MATKKHVIPQLTKREIQVLKLICKEKSNEQIAKDLKLSVHGIDYHRTGLYKKTKAKSMVGLVVYAIKHGFFKV